MPEYIQEALHKFQHSQTTLKEHAPHTWEQPDYGATKQFFKVDDTSGKLLFRTNTKIA